MNSASRNHPSTHDIEERLSELGREHRRMGAEALRGSDLTEAAAALVTMLYRGGDFGPWYRSPFWLGEKATDLAGCLQAWARTIEDKNNARG